MKNYKVMGRDAFLTKRSMVKEFVELENGSGLFIQEMSGSGVEELAKLAANGEKLSNIVSMARIIAQSACDEAGNLLFTLDDVPMIISNNSIATLVKLSEKVVKLNKLTSTSVTEAKNNLKNAKTENSTSI